MPWIRGYLIGFGLLWLFSILWSGSFQEGYQINARLLIGIGSIVLGFFSRAAMKEVIIRDMVFLVSGVVFLSAVLLVIDSYLSDVESSVPFSIFVIFHMIIVCLLISIAISMKKSDIQEG